MIDLIHGDCLIQLKKLSKKTIDMVLVDLPYGTTRCKWDTPIPLLEMWEILNDIVKDECPILMFAQTPFDKVLGASNLKMLRYEWIWEKTAATGHLNCKKMPMKAHENILVFYKKLPCYNYQKTTGHSPVNNFYNKIDKCAIYGDTVKVSGGGNTDRYPRSVLKFSSDKQTQSLHPTQKPVKLLEYLIKTYSNEDDTILDFTMGSGSTGVACLNLNRNFIGIEKDENYFKIAKDRLENHV